jgi:hypothetical protein
MKTNVLLYFASTDDNLLTPQNELATAIRFREEHAGRVQIFAGSCDEGGWP